MALGLLAACTEPNPYLPAADASTGASTTLGEPSTSASTSEPTAGSGPDDPSGGSSSGEAPGCGAQGMTCIAAAPEGFAGPFAWLERPVESPLPCAAPFERPLVEAFSELSAPAADCECGCGPLGSTSCGPASVERYAGAACGGAVADTLALEPGCNALAGAGWASSNSFFFDAPAVEGGCVPLASLELTPAAFLTRHLACEGALAQAGCEPGQLCAPSPADPFHGRFCVFHEGDFACPEGSDYADRTLLYRSLDDQRGCEPCTCAVPSVPCAGTTAALSTAFDCSLLVSGIPPEGCVDDVGGGIIHTIMYQEGSVPQGLACEAAVVVPTGDASGIDPVTFCCTG